MKRRKIKILYSWRWRERGAGKYYLKKTGDRGKKYHRPKKREQALYITFLKIIHPHCLKYLVYYSQYKLRK